MDRTKTETARLLTVRQAKAILNVDWSTIYSYISDGTLKAHKMGGDGKSKRHWRIWYSDLVDFINGRRGENAEAEKTTH